MDPAKFFAASRVVIVAGKGGVGKTTVTGALSLAAARAGLSTLILEVEGKSGLAAMFGTEPMSYDEVELSAADPATGRARVSARALTPDDALLEYFREHGMSRLSKRLVNSGALDMVSTAIPGIRDLVVLAKLKQLEQAEAADLIVLDAPAAGHAINFLRSPRGLVDAVKVGPINAQSRDVLGLLNDARRCQVVLVTLPEETPVNELVETAFSLEDQVGVALGPVVVNGLYPDRPGLGTDPQEAAEQAGASLREGEHVALAGAAEFRRRRMALQRTQLERLATQLPLPQLRLPYLFDAELGPSQVATLADELTDDVVALDEAESA